MGVDRIVTAGLALALGIALVGAGPVIASPVAAAEGAAAQVLSTDDTTVSVDDTSVPAAPLSSFVGSITTPARGETTVYVNGDLVLTPASCPRSPINGWKPYRVFAGFLPVGTTSPWTTEYPSFNNITTYPIQAFIDRNIELSAGTYQVYSWALYAEPGGTPARLCERLSDHVVTIVEPVSTQRGITADDSLVVLGERTTLTFVERVTWTDGVVTERVPLEVPGLTLQSRTLGTAPWSEVNASVPIVGGIEQGAKRIVAPTESTEYRFLQYSEPSRSVVVTVAQPTLGRIVSAASLSDTEVMLGATIEIRADLQTQYTDSVWRPSPVGTAFEVQLLPDGGTEWIRLYRDTTDDVGIARLRIPVDGPGRYRITSGGGVGASTQLFIIQPTSQVAIEAPDLPVQVSPGTPIDLSAPVEIQYSDGIYRPAPDGTAYRVQFAVSGPRSAMRWRTVMRGTITDGQITTRIKPKRTGYWRLTVAGNASSATLVRVR
jgi:hypothetical protein